MTFAFIRKILLKEREIEIEREREREKERKREGEKERRREREKERELFARTAMPATHFLPPSWCSHALHNPEATVQQQPPAFIKAQARAPGMDLLET
jgi:hypothetical protein